jgi:hypothetical protein
LSYGQELLQGVINCSHSRCSEPDDETSDAEVVAAAFDDVRDVAHKCCDESAHTWDFHVDVPHVIAAVVRGADQLDRNWEEELQRTIDHGGRDARDDQTWQSFLE